MDNIIISQTFNPLTSFESISLISISCLLLNVEDELIPIKDNSQDMISQVLTPKGINVRLPLLSSIYSSENKSRSLYHEYVEIASDNIQARELLLQPIQLAIFGIIQDENLPINLIPILALPNARQQTALRAIDPTIIFNKLIQSGIFKQEITSLQILMQFILKADLTSSETIQNTLRSIFCEPEDSVKTINDFRRFWSTKIGIFIGPIEGFHRILTTYIILQTHAYVTSNLNTLPNDHPLIFGPSCICYQYVESDNNRKFCHSISNIALKANTSSIAMSAESLIISAIQSLVTMNIDNHPVMRSVKVVLTVEMIIQLPTFVNNYMMDFIKRHDYLSNLMDPSPANVSSQLELISKDVSDYKLPLSTLNKILSLKSRGVNNLIRLIYSVVLLDAIPYYRGRNTIGESIFKNSSLIIQESRNSTLTNIEALLRYIWIIANGLNISEWITKWGNSQSIKSLKGKNKHILIMASGLLSDYIEYYHSWTDHDRLLVAEHMDVLSNDDVEDEDLYQYPMGIKWLHCIKSFLELQKPIITNGIGYLAAANLSTDWFVALSLRPVNVQFSPYIEYPDKTMNFFRFIQGVMAKNLLAPLNTNEVSYASILLDLKVR